jgi:Mg/Co/Ni transporter MgtE
MSARAAWRLESLGFSQVFRYAAGKMDWLARGLPREGAAAAVIQAGDLVRQDVPTCQLAERIGVVRERVQVGGWDTCVVVNDEQVVLGLLRGAELGANPDQVVAAVMQGGPKTYRANVLPQDTLVFMRKHQLDSVLVTSPDGQLIGLLKQSDAEQVASRGQA